MALDPNLIPTRANGQTIDETWYNILKTYFIDIFATVDDLSAGSNRKMEVQGHLAILGDTTTRDQGVTEWIAEQPFTLDGMVLIGQKVRSGTGVLEVTASRKRGVAAFVPLLITNPEVAMADGDYQRSDSGAGSAVDAQIDTVVEEILAGDIIRVDIKEAPAVTDLTLGMRGFSLNFQITPGA